MKINSFYNDARKSLSVEDIAWIQETLYSRGYTSTNKLVRFDKLTNEEKLNLKRVVHNILLLRSIYNYFKESILVTELDELVGLITPCQSKEIVDFMRQDPINPNPLCVRDTPTARYAILKKASILLYKLCGVGVIESYDGTRNVTEDMIINAKLLKCTSVVSKYTFLPDEVERVNNYLYSLTSLLYSSQITDSDRESVERLGKDIVLNVASNANIYLQILDSYKSGLVVLELIKERLAPTRVRKYNKVIKNTISNVCACGSEDLSVVDLVKVTSNETDSKSVKIKYKCKDCGIETEKVYDMLANIALSVI